MSAIITADTHFDDKPLNEYRWRLFDWLAQQKADELLVLGDTTDAKDRHSAPFVNRFYNAIMKLENHFRIIILKGNHDYVDPDHPYWEFIGTSSDIRFIKSLEVLKLSIGSATFVPAGAKWGSFKLHQTDYLFTHATF